MQTLEQLRAGELNGIQRLTLRCGLTAFPQDIYALADSLEILDLSGNLLSSLPDDLHRLSRLKVIFCSQNRFTVLPEVLGRCPSLQMIGFKSNQIAHVPASALPPTLRWLTLTDNRIAELPPALGRCSELQKLMLAGNQLTTLPDSLAQCQKLELIRISANQLHALPEWLFDLPRLTWLAYAGNPFMQKLEQSALRTPLKDIAWSHLTMGRLLGEGASGLIYQATYQAESGMQEVAVKLFKGAMTSDGLPLCEMASTMKAGSHDGLTQTLGRVSQHPENIDGLVMTLIPAAFDNLAGPPSLDSCTRDIYADSISLTPKTLLNIVTQIASAVSHLHQQGIMHGDLYAHNILWQQDGDALVSDYGAASFFDVTSEQERERCQGLEVRAFGCLLEELLFHCASMPLEMRETLQQMMDACLQPRLSDRPSWDDLLGQLEAFNGQLN